MRLESRNVKISNRVAEMIVLSHGEEEMLWQMLERTSRDADLDLFEQINAFWAEQPPEWHDRAFDLYRQIHPVILDSTDIHQLRRDVTPLVTELLDMHDLDKIRDWVEFRSKMLVPSSVPDAYVEGERQRTRTKTYTRADYLSFTSLSIALRPILPIWGEFIYLTKSELRPNWKEYLAFQLISQAKLMTSEPMSRLREYIVSMLPGEEDVQSAILVGISSEDYPDWITAIIIIRRLVIADIRGLADRQNAVAYIFSYLTNRTAKNWNNSLAGNILSKRNTDGFNPDADNKQSLFEDYKVKERIPAGDVVSIEHELTMPQRVALAVCKNLDLALLAKSQESTRVLVDKEITDTQRAFAGFLMARWIPARSQELFQKLSLIESVSITQAILWFHGFYDLAALSSAIIQKYSAVAYSSGPIGKQPSVPKEMQEELDRLYPLHRRLSQKNKSQKEKNNTVIRIDQLTDQFRENDWLLTLPNEWLPMLSRNTHGRRYVAPVDLKIMLTQLVLRIGQRSL